MSQSNGDRFDEAVPRYTSYPTAPHFGPAVGPAEFAGWLESVPPGEPVSIYVHVPFCDRLCWFCACHTKQTLRYEPVARFLAGLHDEIALARRHLPGRLAVKSLHLGGGSPTMLRPEDMIALKRAARNGFRFRAGNGDQRRGRSERHGRSALRRPRRCRRHARQPRRPGLRVGGPEGHQPRSVFRTDACRGRRVSVARRRIDQSRPPVRPAASDA